MKIPLSKIERWQTVLSNCDVVVTSKILLAEELRVHGVGINSDKDSVRFEICADGNLFLLRVLRESFCDTDTMLVCNKLGNTLTYPDVSHLEMLERSAGGMLLSSSSPIARHSVLVTSEYILDIVGPGVPVIRILSSSDADFI